MQRNVWLALSYNVPINPSKIRVYVWRKLKEFGAEYFKQGVALLPNTPQSMQQFTALANKIRQMGGEASIVELRFTDPADEIKMTAKFQLSIEDEYKELLADCANALGELKKRRDKQQVSQQEAEHLKKMIKRDRKTKSRDYFKASQVRELEEDIYEVIDSVLEVAGDFGKQLKKLMET